MRVLRRIFKPADCGEAEPAIMGVCSYFANRFGLDVLPVRIAVVAVAYLTSVSKIMVPYIIIGVILSLSQDDRGKPRKKKSKKKTVKIKIDLPETSSEEIRPTDRHEKQAEAQDSGYSPARLSRTSVKQLDRSLKRLDTRLSSMEGYVTSSQFRMAKDFRDLGKETTSV
ncbi:PspC domain-containing protein [Endozoicomonas arenosclerae]|uniref:PspC domain-containing protein n=1 Tax=Endozoicomonas arenosclerae TaxID=1633495 RepID=UPI00078066A3|nr:PspC domain-containing protein [Endozoicomonas arenosclerae]